MVVFNKCLFEVEFMIVVLNLGMSSILQKSSFDTDLQTGSTVINKKGVHAG